MADSSILVQAPKLASLVLMSQVLTLASGDSHTIQTTPARTAELQLTRQELQLVHGNGGAGAGAPAWGGITGLLKNQADLLAALAAKQTSLNHIVATDYDINGDGSLYVKGDSDGALAGTDDAPAINALITAATAAGKPIDFPAKAYRIGSSLMAASGMSINARGATFVKTFSGPLWSQASYATAGNKISKVFIDGGTHTTPNQNDNAYAGDIFKLYGDYITIRDVVIDRYGGPTDGGRACLLGGDHNRVNNLTALRPYPGGGTGGIRNFGGTDFVATDCKVISGDDCYQFVPIIPGATAIADMSIAGSSYIGCWGYSYTGRLMVAIIGNGTSDVNTLPPATAAVSDCAFISVKGYAWLNPLTLQNTDSAGAIKGLRVTDCELRCDPANAADTFAAYLNCWTCSGGMKDIMFDGCAVRTPNTIGLRASGVTAFTPGGTYDATLTTQTQVQPIKNLSWNGGEIEAPLVAVLPTVQLAGVDGFTMGRTRIDAPTLGADAIYLGAGATSGCLVSNAVLSEITIAGITNGQYGINNHITDRTIARGVKFICAAGATTAGAVLNAAVASPIGGQNGIIEACDISALNNASPFVNDTVNGNIIYAVKGYSTQNLVQNVPSSSGLLAGGDLLNAIDNASFELGDIGWTKGSNWTIGLDAANAKHGNYVATCTDFSGAGKVITSQSRKDCQPNDLIYGGTWYKTDGLWAGSLIRTEIVFYDASGAVLSTATGTNTPGINGTYTLLSFIATAPANAVSFAAQFRTAQTAGQVWADAPVARRLTDAATLLQSSTITPALLASSVFAAMLARTSLRV